MPGCSSSFRNNIVLWLWVPAFAGTTKDCASLHPGYDNPNKYWEKRP
jgi:hypothetical protein